MMQPASKRRICSFDMAEVTPQGYVLAEEQGEMYFCNARCICLWAMHFVTNPRRSDEQKRIPCELTLPSEERIRFADFIEAAQWSVANVLQGDSLERTATIYPTAEEINALPEKFRGYIHDLATRCDKSGDVQTIAILGEHRDALQRRVEELEPQMANQKLPKKHRKRTA
jgi:hypothetical protein